MLKLYVPITKIDEERREVWGFATVEELDKQGEVVSFDASKRAFAAWSDQFEKATDGASQGNIREMHQPIAAGRVLEWTPDEEKKGINLGGKIVDDQAWAKTRERVYTGFSIGGNPKKSERRKIGGKNVNVITEYDLVEVSLVDNPACPSAVFSVVKMAGASPAETVPIEKQVKVIWPGPALPPAPEEGWEKKDPTTIQTLVLSRDKFKSADDAKKWAREHDFKGGAVDETEDSYHIRQRDPGDFKDDSFRTVSLKDGVQAVVGNLKLNMPRERFMRALEKVRKQIPGAALPHSEGPSVHPAIEALHGIMCAIDCEIWEMTLGMDSEVEKADVVVLAAAFDSLLEFLGNEMQQQVRALTAPGGPAPLEGMAALARLNSLLKALSPTQAERLKAEPDVKANMQAMHEMCHAMCKATMAMGAECKMCKDAADQEEIPAEDKPAGEEEAPAEEKKSELPSTSIPEGVLAKAIDEVKGMVAPIKSIEERLRKLEGQPASIGRPVASAPKSLPGATGDGATDMDVAVALTTMAEAERQPELKERLLMRAAELSIKHIQAQPRKP